MDAITFTPDLERHYRRTISAERRRAMLTAGGIALVILGLFAAEYFLIADPGRSPANMWGWFASMAVITVLVLIFTAIHAFVDSALWRDRATIAVLLFLSPVVCVCITFGDPVARPAGLFAYVLMPIACNTLVALHFRQAMLVSGASLLVFVVYLAMLPEVAIDVKLQAWLVCAAATTMTAWANWRTDRGDRIAFLWLTRERLVAEMTQRRAEELHEMSKIDPLTGIANRRVFEERLGAHARGETLALIMVDIDHFKLFNDHYGHLAGDQCLQRVARALAEGVRTPDDLVARLGGEEFVILMPGLGAEGIMPVLDRLRRTVERLAIPHAGVRGDATDVVTISLGCAVAQPESSEECRALLTRADRALYRAKNEGRNRWRLTA